MASTFHDHLFKQYGDAHSSNHLELPLFAKSQQPTINLPNLEETVASAEMDGLRIQLLDQFVMDVSDVVVHVVDGALHWRRMVSFRFIPFRLELSFFVMNCLDLT